MWFLWALLCAFLVGCSDLLSKLALRRQHEAIVGWARLLFSLPLLGLVLFFVRFPPLSAQFWLISIGMIPLELTAFILYLRAIRLSPLSLTIPFLALTPVFTIFTSWIILGETVSRAGGLGILVIVLGMYLLHATAMREGPFEPLRAVFREPGTRLIVVAAFLYSITSNLGKWAIQLSNPASFAFLYHVLDMVALFWIARARAGGIGPLGKALKPQLGLYAAIGTIAGLAILVHCIGIAQAPVPYFIAIKRTSLLAAVLTGGFILKEERIGQRLLGASLMVAGVALIAFGG